MTYLDLIERTRAKYDLNKTLGTLTKGGIIMKMSQQYDNAALKIELKKCTNFNQMINVIEQMTGELSKERTNSQLTRFQGSIDKIVKLARL